MKIVARKIGSSIICLIDRRVVSAYLGTSSA